MDATITQPSITTNSAGALPPAPLETLHRADWKKPNNGEKVIEIVGEDLPVSSDTKLKSMTKSSQWKVQEDLFGDTGPVAHRKLSMPNMKAKAPISKELRAQLRQDAKNLKVTAQRKSITLEKSEEYREAFAAKEHFELGCWLKYFSVRIYAQGAEGLQHRVHCLLRLLLSGITQPNYDFYTVFDFGERHFDTIFEMGDSDQVKSALLSCLPYDTSGRLVQAFVDFGWREAGKLC